VSGPKISTRVANTFIVAKPKPNLETDRKTRMQIIKEPWSVLDSGLCVREEKVPAESVKLLLRLWLPTVQE
jgi:hypothetical protein